MAAERIAVSDEGRAAFIERAACEERVRFLARQLAELVEINFTLKRQRDAAQAELREFKRATP